MKEVKPHTRPLTDTMALTSTVGMRWIAGTGLAGAGDSTLGTGNVDGSPVASVSEIAAALHKPVGVAYVVRFGFSELQSQNGKLSLRDLCAYTDFLALVVLDIVDSANPMEAHAINDGVWLHLEATFETLLRQLRERAAPEHVDSLLPLHACANKLLLLLRLVHLRSMPDHLKPAAVTQEGRYEQIRSWLHTAVQLRTDLQGRAASFPFDELPGAYVELALAQLQAGLSALPPPVYAFSDEGDDAGTFIDPDAAKEAALAASVARPALTCLPFATAGHQAPMYDATHALAGAYLDRLDREQVRHLPRSPHTPACHALR